MIKDIMLEYYRNGITTIGDLSDHQINGLIEMLFAEYPLKYLPLIENDDLQRELAKKIIGWAATRHAINNSDILESAYQMLIDSCIPMLNGILKEVQHKETTYTTGDTNNVTSSN